MCVTDKVSLIRSLSDYEGWRSTYQDKDWIVEAIFFEASCITVGLFDTDSGVKRCEHGARSAECLQRAA